MSYWDTLASWGGSVNHGLMTSLSAVNTGVKSGLNLVIPPQQMIAEREQLLGVEFVSFKQGLQAVKTTLDKCGCSSPVEQSGIFHFIVESVEGGEHFFQEYKELPIEHVNGIMDDEKDEFTDLVRPEKIAKEVFENGFLKCRQAFCLFLEEGTRGNAVDSIFDEIKKKIGDIYVEKESVAGIVVDGFRGWLRSTSTSVISNTHQLWLSEIEKMQEEWRQFIPELYQKICRKIWILDSKTHTSLDMKINEVVYRMRFCTHFDYREKKKRVNFQVDLSSEVSGKKYSVSFLLRRNIHERAFEIVAVENECDTREVRDRMDLLIYQLIAEILLKEADAQYIVARIKVGRDESLRSSSSSASASRLSCRRTSTSEVCRRENLTSYGYEALPLEDVKKLPYDYTLSHDGARGFLGGKTMLLEGCRIDLI